MNKVCIGILGAGRIASIMANTIWKMEEATVYAVASRSVNKAQEFASNFAGCKAYGSYEEMVKDPKVDLVYIATPHSHHFEHASLCIQHHKPVLCEKAFTVNAKQAKELLLMARDNNVFITEAMWTRFMPSRQQINKLIEEGVIGTPYMISANLGYLIAHKERIANLELAGGALLDIGIYPINFASMVFGNQIEKITSCATLSEKGVDEQGSITIQFATGQMAVLHTTTKALTDRQGIISGNNGYMIIENINNPECIKIYDTNRTLIATHEVPPQISGYEYEVLACIRAIKEGKLECEEMPHKETIRLMELMDGLRKEWGAVYPADDK